MLFLSFSAKSKEKIQKLVEKIEKNYNLQRDPNDLVILERQDFTNFLVFFDDFHENAELSLKLANFFAENETSSEKSRYFMRFCYILIYEAQTNADIIEKTEEKNEQTAKKVEESAEINEISAKIKEEEKKQGNIFGDSGFKDRNMKEEIHEVMQKSNKIEENTLKESKSNEWEIDDKLLIFS